MPSATGPWQAASPQDAVAWLGSLRSPWWIAGGWALDLFAGAQCRAHADLDIGVLRKDVIDVLSALQSWEFFEARDGLLTRLKRGDHPRAEVNSLWCRPMRSSHWALELLLDQGDGRNWRFRRDARIQRSFASLVRYDPEGIPYLAPEVQLLYKGKAGSIRPRDQDDFDRVAPLLDAGARAWLAAALRTIQPRHEWLSKLVPGSDP